MAKAKQTTSEASGSIGSRTAITLNSEHDGSPNLYDVMVSGRRVGYIIDAEPYPVTPLPAKSIGLKLTAAELKEVASVAREAIKAIVAERDAAGDDLDRILAGE